LACDIAPPDVLPTLLYPIFSIHSAYFLVAVLRILAGSIASQHAIKESLVHAFACCCSSMDVFRVRLNCLDHYQAIPTEFDPPLPLGNSNRQAQEKSTPKVPVIRAFGATETGQKVCAHIHGALPYLYLEYHGSLVPEEG